MNISEIELDTSNAKPTQIFSLFSDSYNVHKAIWTLFADHEDRERDFIFRQANSKYTDSPTFYTISERIPVDKNNVWNIKTQSYNPKFYEGQKLKFLLKANPVKKRNNKKIDIVTHKREELEKIGTPFEKQPSASNILHLDGCKWIQQKGDLHGFNLQEDSFFVNEFNKEKLVKPNNNVMTIATADFRGVLEVTDVEKFRDAAFHGIGPSKSFGCGMLLLTPC